MNENKFDGMGKLYAKFRPSYPSEFIDYLFAYSQVSNKGVIADIGAGTGILTRQLLEHGNTVYAVEPNSDMIAVAKKDLSELEGFIPVDGAAESTGLEDGSIDLVTVAQAFHWFDRMAFGEECRRILRPSGRVALVWNSRDEKSELVLETDRVIREHCPNFKGFSQGMRGATAEEDFSDFFKGGYGTRVFENPLCFDEEGFIGRNLSSSYALKEADEGYSSFVKALRALFDRYSENGILIMPNLTRSYIGRP